MAVSARLTVMQRNDGPADPAFRADVLAGLAQRQKAVPARWLYDFRGSELFEQITRLPEYYLTRVETALLRDKGDEMARLAGKGRAVIEFGAGSTAKTPLLLAPAETRLYVPIDISGNYLRQSSHELAARLPHLRILPVEADFMRPVPLPDAARHTDLLGFFPGSTIGNLIPSTAVDLLRSFRETLGEGSKLLIGFDLVKPVARLVAAYDDTQGVTAKFNRNLLHRINRELDGDIPADKFRHVARWNEKWQRIEMHLEALHDMAFTIAGHPFTMQEGETIHTENSHKYAPGEARLMMQAAGWSPQAQWTDASANFLIMLAEATEPRSAP